MSVHTHPKERQREPLIVVGFKIVEITLKTAIEACYIVAAIGKDFSYYAGVNFSYNKNRVTKFKGDLIKTWTDGVYSNNLSDVTAGYGSGKLWSKIFSANPQIKNASMIYVGQTLPVPAK